MIASKATGVFVNMTSCSGETTVLAFFFFFETPMFTDFKK